MSSTPSTATFPEMQSPDPAARAAAQIERSIADHGDRGFGLCAGASARVSVTSASARPIAMAPTRSVLSCSCPSSFAGGAAEVAHGGWVAAVFDDFLGQLSVLHGQLHVTAFHSPERWTWAAGLEGDRLKVPGVDGQAPLRAEAYRRRRADRPLHRPLIATRPWHTGSLPTAGRLVDARGRPHLAPWGQPERFVQGAGAAAGRHPPRRSHRRVGRRVVRRPPGAARRDRRPPGAHRRLGTQLPAPAGDVGGDRARWPGRVRRGVPGLLRGGRASRRAPRAVGVRRPPPRRVEPVDREQYVKPGQQHEPGQQQGQIVSATSSGAGSRSITTGSCSTTRT